MPRQARPFAVTRWGRNADHPANRVKEERRYRPISGTPSDVPTSQSTSTSLSQVPGMSEGNTSACREGRRNARTRSARRGRKYVRKKGPAHLPGIEREIAVNQLKVKSREDTEAQGEGTLELAAEVGEKVYANGSVQERPDIRPGKSAGGGRH